MLISELTQGETLNNDELCTCFKCSPQGGMRRSLETNTLVLVSNHVKSIYDDRWIGDTFHYTGMGQSGDQALTFAQNRTLAESGTNGVVVHLFEVEEEGQYIYQGVVGLSGEPYTEKQPDFNGLERNVFVFPLKLKTGSPSLLAYDIFKKTQKQRERKVKKLDKEQLRQKAQRTRTTAGERIVASVQYERDQYVAEYTKARAEGVCDLCEKQAPFMTKDGSAYLESHHIQWLSRGGKDVLCNTVALCPNCHRRMHILDSESDREKLIEKALSYGD